MSRFSIRWIKEDNTSVLYLVLLTVGIVLLTFGYIWSSFLCKIIAYILVICNSFTLISSFCKGDVINGPSGIEIVLLTLFLSFLFSNTRYITKKKDNYHRYINCPAIIKDKTVEKTSKFECIFHYKLKMCDICEERMKKESSEQNDAYEEELDDNDEMYYEFRRI